MNLYIATPSTLRHIAASIASIAEQCGFKISHRWWEDYHLRDDYAKEATLDLLAVIASDALVVWYDPDVVSEGIHVELGTAYAKGKRILVIVHQDKYLQAMSRSIWLHLKTVDVATVDSVAGVAAVLEEYAKA